MPDKSTPHSSQAAIKRRVKNESDTKHLNERKFDKAAEQTEDSDESLLHTMSFDCECDSKSCKEIIQMSTDEYEHVHQNANTYVVIPPHVRLDIEKILARFSNYLIVEKLPVLG